MSNGENLNLTPQCAAGVDTRRRVKNLEKNNEDQWHAINQLRNRLPIWATMIISLLTFLLGCSVTYAAIAKGGPT